MTHAEGSNKTIFTLAGEPEEAALREAVKSSGYVPGGIEPAQSTGDDADLLAEYRLPIDGMTCADCDTTDTFAPYLT